MESGKGVGAARKMKGEAGGRKLEGGKGEASARELPVGGWEGGTEQAWCGRRGGAGLQGHVVWVRGVMRMLAQGMDDEDRRSQQVGEGEGVGLGWVVACTGGGLPRRVCLALTGSTGPYPGCLVSQPPDC